MEHEGHEQVVFCCDRSSGLRSIVAIHDTTLGPGLGGIRMRAYASESEALTDVLKLSEAMTLKASLAGLEFGGGKRDESLMMEALVTSRLDTSPTISIRIGQLIWLAGVPSRRRESESRKRTLDGLSKFSSGSLKAARLAGLRGK